MAPALVHVGGHLPGIAHHCTLPHTVRVEESIWNDTSRTQQDEGVLILISSKPVLCHPVRTHCLFQDAKVLDGSIPDEPVGHLLLAGAVQLHRQPRCRHGGREDL